MTVKKAPNCGQLNKSGENFAQDTLGDKIGGNLRQIYDDVVNEPVPDDFLALLLSADDVKS